MGCAASRDALPHSNKHRVDYSSSSKTKSTTVCDKEEEFWHPDCPLKKPEMEKLWDSWAIAEEKMPTAGAHMFLILFQQRPVLLNIFTQFGTKGLNSLSLNDPDLRRHANTVMGHIDETIKNLDKVEEVRPAVRRAGKAHRMFMDFDVSYFRLMREPFLTAVQAALEDVYTPSMEKIYEKVIDWILNELEEGFESF